MFSCMDDHEHPKNRRQRTENAEYNYHNEPIPQKGSRSLSRCLTGNGFPVDCALGRSGGRLCQPEKTC
jgi:hypothetical protein